MFYNIVAVICLLFSISGFCNYGSTSFLLALPFMVVLFIYGLSKNHLGKVLLFFIIGLFINQTILKNSIFFPILEGEVVVKTSGFFISDKFKPTTYSESFYITDIDLKDFSKEKEDFNILSKINVGEKLKVKEIFFDDLFHEKTLIVKTEKGHFNSSDFNNGDVHSDLALENPLTKDLGFLMDYPLFILLLIFYRNG